VIFRLVVTGVPVPQGSLKHIGRGRLIPSNEKKLKVWREAIAEVANEFTTDSGFDLPAIVTVVFTLPRPKTVKRLSVTVPPDLDKLQRAVGDALSINCKLINDDAQIIEWHSRKEYGDVGGAVIQVEFLEQ
jgi:Holliday junction resolvase RusA-like endonuclease